MTDNEAITESMFTPFSHLARVLKSRSSVLGAVMPSPATDARHHATAGDALAQSLLAFGRAPTPERADRQLASYALVTPMLAVEQRLSILAAVLAAWCMGERPA